MNVETDRLKFIEYTVFGCSCDFAKNILSIKYLSLFLFLFNSNYWSLEMLIR